MAVKVTWLGKAADRIQSDLLPLFTRELKTLFPKARTVTVYDSFGGYSQNHIEKVVLGVEVCGSNSYHTHVVKLGRREKVANDYDGWRKCVLQRNFASRIMVSLSKRELPGERAAVVYEDAYRFFGTPDEGQGPQSLETVVFWSVMDNKPSPESVERVIRQIYTDLYRWFYRASKADPEAAHRFYQARLRRAMDRWRNDSWRTELRRDLLWLLCSHDDLDAFDHVAFLDPFDYVSWALTSRRFPQTLVGRSHGDLHGRNVYVGVQRREAEYPAVFDYGEMDSSNVLVWDFVKLETELKVRLLAQLYADPHAQEVLFSLEDQHGLQKSRLKRSEWPTAHLNAHSLRAHRVEFAFKFESVLALLTDHIHKLSDPSSAEPPGGRRITGEPRLDRALGILLRVRQEAALFLGDGQPHRGQCGLWKDEYYFALAVYGLSTAKFDYKESEAAFALVSAGVAAARTEMARSDILAEIADLRSTGLKNVAPRHYPSYHVPVAFAHRLWKAHRSRENLDAAIAVLDAAAKDFSHAVVLQQEYALLLAEAGRQVGALKLLEPLNGLCEVFRDEETLSRIGRTCKELGDHSLRRQLVPVSELADHPAWQWYNTAMKHYRVAFDMSHDYYPAINAATLALICGDRDASRELAEKVLEICRARDLGRLRRDERFWIVVTEGEAMLLLGEEREAVTFYQQALSSLSTEGAGLAQSVYNQVCRLAWALGLEKIRSVVELFECYPFRLHSGPLGDCGGLVKRQHMQVPAPAPSPAASEPDAAPPVSDYMAAASRTQT